jgi:hypothetical protein
VENAGQTGRESVWESGREWRLSGMENGRLFLSRFGAVQEQIDNLLKL